MGSFIRLFHDNGGQTVAKDLVVAVVVVGVHGEVLFGDQKQMTLRSMSRE